MTTLPNATSPGLGIDAAGDLAVDPTKNVLNLVDAEGRRQDDLRLAGERLSDVKHEHAKALIDLHSNHERELREAEAKRLDAIRSVDVAAAALREERADRAATALANQVATTAETLRSLVATTATAAAASSAAVTNPLSERIAVLEKGSYEGTGKAAVTDPAMAKMIAAVEALTAAQASKTGQGVGMEKLWGWIAAAVAVLYAILNSAGKL